MNDTPYNPDRGLDIADGYADDDPAYRVTDGAKQFAMGDWFDVVHPYDPDKVDALLKAWREGNKLETLEDLCEIMEIHNELDAEKLREEIDIIRINRGGGEAV